MVDILNYEERLDILQDVQDILEDCDLSVNILYRRIVPSSRVFNVSTGANTPTYIDTPIIAILANHTARDVANSGGTLKVGDVFFMFAQHRLPYALRPDDRIACEVTGKGHVVLTNNQVTVTGYNTKFFGDGLQGGDLLSIDDTLYDIAKVTSETGLNLKTAWAGSSEPAKEYKTYRIYEIVVPMQDPIKACVRLSARRAGG